MFELPLEDLKALLTGKTTNLQAIKIKNQEVEQSMNVKLSVQRYADGSLNLMIHPIRNEIKNDDNLNNAQLETLKKGETLIASKISMNGEKELYLFQLDRETRVLANTWLSLMAKANEC